MREIMAGFLSTQLDFILFFYGLAFLLLGSVCLSISRGEREGESWGVLGLFAVAHGVGEWLDLTALIISDSPEFAVVRIALMTGSFMLLMEFARRNAIRLGLKLQGRWLYPPLVLLVAFGGFRGGLTTAGDLARYAIGFVGASATSIVFVWDARRLSGAARRFAIFAAVGFAFYAAAAGAIVPAAPFWPADRFNHDWFVQFTGIPVQFVRGLLACWIAFSIWAIWGHQLILEVSSERYTAYLRRQFIWTLAAMATILVFGWVFTEFLGGIYKQNVQEEARGDIDLLASRLTGETSTLDGMVKALAGSPSVLPLLVGGIRQDEADARWVLDLDVDASGAKIGYILDRSGTIVASSDHSDAAPSDAFRSSSYFQKSIGGEPGYYFSFDPANKERNYYASYPVRARGGGAIVGVAILKKSLDAFETDLAQFDRPYFLINPDGIVVLTNQQKMLFRTLWPLSAEKQLALVQQFGKLNDRPMLAQQIVDATWINVGGERNYVRRRNANHSQWSLVILEPIHEIFASRVLGIIVTLLIALMSLIYLFGKERWIHDNVQMEKRLKLQELARDLRFQATTDPLTGLSNRLKFDQTLAAEMSRSMRYETPLSLVLYDIDNFKVVNDIHGHQTGDKVLVQLSRFVAGLLRNTDLLARWGGEEFVILTPGSDGETAYQVAEKLKNAIEQVKFDEIETVTCSFGVAQYVYGDTAETLISRADDALYRAKLNGRNQVELASLPSIAQPMLVSVASSAA
jgi:diguanylate cyclase (GGDEF)-like protein